MEAKKVEDGWLMGESEAAYKRVHGVQSGPGFNPKNCLPQQVQLTVTSAPAEFCLPMKNDRQFKPHFQVQVSLFIRVRMGSPTCCSCQMKCGSTHSSRVSSSNRLSA